MVQIVDLPLTTSITGSDFVPVSQAGVLKRVAATTLNTNIPDGDKGQVSVSGSGSVWTVNSGLDAIKIADGTVSNTEFQYLNGTTSNIQTQLNTLAATGTGDMFSTNNLSDVANVTTARSNLGLAIGTNVQAYDAELAALAGLTSAADALPYFTGAGTASTTTLSSAGRALMDDATASDQRTTLGLAIGTNVQAYDAELAALAGLTSAADKGIQFTGVGTAGTYDLTTAGKALLDDATASDQRTTLGLAIGTNVQAYDAELAAIAGLTSAADALPYFTGSGTASTTTLTTAARTVLDDTTVGAMVDTLGGASSTGSGGLVRTTSPILATPVLGVASATSVNKLAITAPATAATLTIADGTTLATNVVTPVLGQVLTYNGTHWAESTPAGTGDMLKTENLSGLANYTTARSNLGLTVGTDVQAYDAELAALAGLTSAADALPYFTGAGTASTTTLTSFARTVLDDTTADAARTTLDAARVQYVATVGGTANAITLTPTSALTAYAAGVEYVFIPTGTNATSGGTTVAVSGLAARSVKKFIGGTVVALAANDLTVGQPVHIIDDGTQFILLNPAVGTGGNAIASASTINLNAALGDYIHITGTTTITALTLRTGREINLVFDGVCQLTHSANLLLPGSVNFTTAAGDFLQFRADTSSIVKCVGVLKADGTPVALPAVATFGTSVTTGTVNSTNLTASQITATDASKNLQSLSTGTYPSLTELAYVKGVTSAIQTQLDAAASKYVLLGTATASASASLDITSLISSSYSLYKIVIVDLVASASSALHFKSSTNNGSTWTSNMSYDRHAVALGSGVAPTYAGGSSTSPAVLTGTSCTRYSGHADMVIASGGQPYMSLSIEILTDSGSSMTKSWVLNPNAAVTAIQFLPSTGTLTSGKIYLYGVKNT